ncbi:increased DNA methylation 3-like isoform X1 [Neltuma alba]|uniref:increased DNA methylation 3-like isoform X1 n=1 Tax=Neltuma alba TaxID=207710 RepID=UPI0010A3826F|nr:increased DNA methylation 3-like isoform X1 [Prosopis alba]XP_028791933.1 increased DNA methylation 3-like isoform X1 [Prosopis alba]XP_028791934.1 increased DNA methylation 3-like isoform X1 [Prosopis alba]XP_028791935.1 increased DNA methylation 3-like isoform X1 [Prosopis alba]
MSAQNSQFGLGLNGKTYHRRSVKPLISDAEFLLNFIMSTYLGPDVKSDEPRCSAAQRLGAGLPPYTLSALGPSYVSISLLERLYYFVLRDAQPDQVLERNLLHMYLKGELSLPSCGSVEECQQFTSIFPLNLHEQIWYPDSFRIVKGVVLIIDPVASYMKQEDIKRFKYLTGVNSLKIDINACLHAQLGSQAGKEVEHKHVNKDQTTISNEECPQFQQKHKQKCILDSPSITEYPGVFPIKQHGKRDPSKRVCKSNGPTLMPVLRIPDAEDCDIDASLHLAGTARRGLLGPPVGVVDIGISKVAYLFRVSLPGVMKDHASQFNCEVESDGRVHIQGLLSGGRTIKKNSRVFQMKIQHLCPPGPFTLSFSLPGPVDPRLLALNFRSDGIFEAVVIKQK